MGYRLKLPLIPGNQLLGENRAELELINWEHGNRAVHLEGSVETIDGHAHGLTMEKLRHVLKGLKDCGFISGCFDVISISMSLPPYSSLISFLSFLSPVISNLNAFHVFSDKMTAGRKGQFVKLACSMAPSIYRPLEGLETHEVVALSHACGFRVSQFSSRSRAISLCISSARRDIFTRISSVKTNHHKRTVQSVLRSSSSICDCS